VSDITSLEDMNRCEPVMKSAFRKMEAELQAAKRRIGVLDHVMELLAQAAGKARFELIEAEDALTIVRQQLADRDALIAFIDAKVPRADHTCDEPGITFSEACRRESQPLVVRKLVTRSDWSNPKNMTVTAVKQFATPDTRWPAEVVVLDANDPRVVAFLAKHTDK
jgi:hypothetical protein